MEKILMNAITMKKVKETAYEEWNEYDYDKYGNLIRYKKNTKKLSKIN